VRQARPGTASQEQYGPIRAGDGGIEYLTLRRAWDPGAKYMPAMRDRLVRGRQRLALLVLQFPATA